MVSTSLFNKIERMLEHMLKPIAQALNVSTTGQKRENTSAARAARIFVQFFDVV